MPNNPSKFPKITSAAQKGETGVNIVKSIIETDFKWIFRRIHQEHDFGLDAFIDIVTDENYLTGKSIALQIKCGDSFFRESNEIGWVYRGDGTHLNYYLNLQIPLLIILVNEKEKKAYWQIFNFEQTDKAGENWKITIPFNQELISIFKTNLKNLTNPVTDYIPQLEHFWAMNSFLKNNLELYCL